MRLVKNKYWVFLLLLGVCLFSFVLADAQCSVCTRTAQQLGEKPAQGLNVGILYLAFTPYVIVGFIAYKWWRKNKAEL